ncbi:glycosyltransferase family 2 protein [Patescibacteria group bacterium]
MKLSVIIVNYKTPDKLDKCISSLKKCNPEIDDVIIIDNDSGDESLDVVRKKFPDAKIVASRINGGLARAINWGFNYAKYDTILSLNPDVIVTENAIQKLYDHLEKEDGIGLIAPKLLNEDGSLQYSCYEYYRFMTPFYRRTTLGKLSFAKKELERFEMREWDHDSPRDVGWAIGAVFMTRRDTIKKIGPMDERYFLYFEDVDLCRRLWESGYRVVYYPEAEMYHELKRESYMNSGISSFFNNLTRIHFQSWMKYLVKNRGKLDVSYKKQGKDS